MEVGNLFGDRGDFNPHPRVGSNSWPSPPRRPSSYFNPHPRVGSNRRSRGTCRPAPAYFNPHPRVGSNASWLIRSRASRVSSRFQSTSPCGEQQSSHLPARPCRTFQSTSPCGEQQKQFRVVPEGFAISIHIPVWGATASGRACPCPHKIFQSTSPCGEQPAPPSPSQRNSPGFQSTSPCGEQRQNRTGIYSNLTEKHNRFHKSTL